MNAMVISYQKIKEKVFKAKQQTLRDERVCKERIMKAVRDEDFDFSTVSNTHDFDVAAGPSILLKGPSDIPQNLSRF
jgi:hypothetical protein